jgi:hypothetical protein
MRIKNSVKMLPFFLALSCISPSFLLMGDGSSNLAWKEFQDPNEKAFTLEVPAGWVVKGGLFRLGYSDTRPMVDIQSPDGQTQVRLGDVAIPSYSVPDQLHREGEVTDLGQQAQLVVARYRPGADYARLYALARFTGVCKRLSPQTIDSAPQMRDYIPQEAAPAQTSAGQVAYRCDSGAQEKVAFAYARTSLFQGLWQVAALGSYLAPPSQSATARAVLLHASESFHILPAWKQYQAGMDAKGLEYQRARQQQRRLALSQQVQAFEGQMSAMRNQVSAFQRRQSAQAAQVTSWGNILTGITPTIDPLNGTTRNVWTGPGSGYWINGQGDVVNSNVSPGAGWRNPQPQ